MDENKGFARTLLIETPQGQRRIGNLSVGDEVYGIDSETGEEVIQKVTAAEPKILHWLSMHGCGTKTEFYLDRQWRPLRPDALIRQGVFPACDITVEPNHNIKLSSGLYAHNKGGAQYGDWSQQGGQTGTTTNAPATWLQPYISQLMQGASGALGRSYPNMGGSIFTSPGFGAGGGDGSQGGGGRPIAGGPGPGPVKTTYGGVPPPTGNPPGYGPAGGGGGGVGGAGPQYHGSFYAKSNPWQQQAIHEMRRAAPGLATGVGDIRNLATGMLQGDYLNANPYLEGAINAANRPVQEQYTQHILPAISSQAQMQGAYGGSRHGVAQGVASGELAQTMADTASAMSSQNYARERELQMMAPQLLGQANEFAMAPSQVNMATGDWRQGQRQNELDARLAKYQYNQLLPFQSLQQFSNILGPLLGFGSQSSAGTNWGQGTSPIGQGNSWLSSLLGIGGLGTSILDIFYGK